MGKAIRDSGIPRNEFFVTTKLSNSDHENVEEALNASLAALGLDYVDQTRLGLLVGRQAVGPGHDRGLGWTIRAGASQV